MATARGIIESALRKIHVFGRGQSLDSGEAQEALEALNNLISSWSVEGAMLYFSDEETFPLDGSLTYTMGTGGDFDTVVPFEINSAFISNGGLDYILDSINQQEYNAIALKTTGSISDSYYFDYDYPTASISLYPVAPSGYSITINSTKRLNEFSGLTTVVDFPPEYRRALIYNLAVDLAPDYEKEAPMTVLKIAGESKSAVIGANTRNDALVSVSDYGGLQGRSNYNIYKGTGVR